MDKQDQLDALFQAARNQKPTYPFGDAKQAFLCSIPTKTVGTKAKKSPFYSLNTWIIMLISISTVLIALVLFSNQEEKQVKEKMPTIQSISSKSTEPFVDNNPAKSKENPVKNSFQPSQTFEFVLDSLQQVSTLSTLAEFDNENPNPEKTNVSLPNFRDEYPFPKLTEKEIAANNKQKKEMLKALEKFDKKSYAFIPSGTFEFLEKQISVQAFYMQKTEVSNLEYRTFLFDLLIQGRKEEFLKAKPDQHQWVVFSEGGMRSLEENYFSNENTNDYPVVNVSREGAELYCKWITQELRKFVGEEKSNEYNDARIPFREEWVKAASVEGKQLPYPWYGEQIRNSDGAILANCVLGYSNDTTSINTDSPDYNIMTPVKSFWPNEYGIYNLAGNVAEMVYDNYTSKFAGTAGGSWKTYYEGVKIMAPDAYKNVISPMPTIGFRVVMTVKTQY